MGTEIYGNTVNASNRGVRLCHIRGGKALVFNNTINTTGSVDAIVHEEYYDSLNPPASSPISGQPQYVSDSYFWRNTKNGTMLIDTAEAGTLNYGSPLGLVPQENREFWQENPSFDGTTGVGVGPLANRPATCTKGVAYWATDTKTLYKCTATNVWTEYYRPYTYPHPLRDR